MAFRLSLLVFGTAELPAGDCRSARTQRAQRPSNSTARTENTETTGLTRLALDDVERTRCLFCFRKPYFTEIVSG